MSSLRRSQLIFAIAVILWLWTAVAFVQATRNNPSPWRTMRFANEAGTTSQRVYCQRQTFADGDMLWRWPCFHLDDDVRSHFIRFDMARGVGDMLWPTEIDDSTPTLGLAKHASRDFAIVFGWGALENPGHYYRVLAGGGVEDLGAPRTQEEADNYLAGLSWVGNNLEAVIGRYQTPTIYTYDSSWQSREVEPVERDREQLCRLELAYQEADSWRLLYTHAPRNPSTDSISVELWLGSDSQPPQPLMEITSTRDKQFFIDESGELQWLDGVFDVSRGGIVMNYIGVETVPFLHEGDSWAEISLPELTDFEMVSQGREFQFQGAFDDYSSERVNYIGYPTMAQTSILNTLSTLGISGSHLNLKNQEFECVSLLSLLLTRLYLRPTLYGTT